MDDRGTDAYWRHQGRQAGYAAGYRQGLSYARKMRIAGQARPPTGRRLDISVLFVGTGQGDPYDRLEQAIVAAMRDAVRALAIAATGDDLVGIARRERPELIMFFNGLNGPTAERATELRSLGFRTAIWLTDDPYYSDVSVKLATVFDYVITNDSGSVPLYGESGCRRVACIPFGASPLYYYPKKAGAFALSDLCFLGSGYANRIRCMKEIADMLIGRTTVIAGRWWERLTANTPVPKGVVRRNRDWLSSEETTDCYNGARIVLNVHRRHDDPEINFNRRLVPARTPNPRTFEIGACGAFQLVDRRPDLEQYYKLDEEIVAFETLEDLRGKLDFYWRHEQARERIALAGLRRTLRDHTYDNRLRQLFGWLLG